MPAVREGLPPTFKMRHDRHYVDELESRSPGVLVRMLPTSEIQLRTPVELDHGAPLVESVRRLGVLQPILVRGAAAGYELIAGARRVAAACAAGLTEVPCRVCAVDDREAQVLAEADDLRAFPAGVRPAAELTGSSEMQRQAATFVPMLGELTDSLRAAASCWDLCADAADRPYATVVRDVTRVELQRATWLVQGLQVLGEQPAMNRTRVNVGVLLEQSFRLTCAERQVALSWQEAVAIGLEAAEMTERSGRGAVPGYQNIELKSGGMLEFLRGRVQAGDPVSSLAMTLNALLPKDRPTQLRLLVSTAGPGSATYKSIGEFVEALKYFERSGRRALLSAVHARAVETPIPVADAGDRGASPIKKKRPMSAGRHGPWRPLRSWPSVLAPWRSRRRASRDW